MHETTPRPTEPRRNFRARWAAIGAAVAVSLGGGGFGIANAVVSNNPQNVYVAITPCRLLDTRPAAELDTGPRTTPIGPAETATFAGTGDVVGPCNLPAGISALQTNVTAVGATSASFLTLFASDVSRPNTSNLNPTPGARPIPNAVTINLAATGTFSVYNDSGSVHVVIDVVGYYDNHRHTTDDITNEPGISYNFQAAATAIGTNTEINSTSIRVPSDGFLNIEATGSFEPSVGGNSQARCQLTLNGTTINTAKAFTWVTSTNSLYSTLSMHRTVPIAVADNPSSLLAGQIVRLLCTNNVSTSSVSSVELTATFYSTAYEPV